MNLEQLAVAVKSNFKKLQEGEIISRIMILSGRNFSRSLSGYNLLIEKKLLPDGFVEYPGYWTRLIARSPTISVLMDRLDGMPGKISKAEFEGFKPPKIVSREEVIQALNLTDLDF